MHKLCSALAVFLLAVSSYAAKPLEFYIVDVEGGQATLIVTPAKQAVLVDAGWPGYSSRDANWIAVAAKAAGVKSIDYMVTTHYHTDHVGGVPQLAAKIPVKTFVDHGPNNETNKTAKELFESYQKAAEGKRLLVKPGDTLPLKGVELTFLTANGDHINKNLAGGGAKNPLCGKPFPADPSENASSVGFLLQYGKFRFIDLGDLTSQKEAELVCPENRVGPVSLYLTTHHGLAASNAQVIVDALHPRVSIMNNGATKGGAPEAWDIIHSSPGLEDLWQVHFAISGGKEHNASEPMIANLVENCEGKYLKVAANEDGSFVVTNSRNKYQKSYPAK